MIVTLTDCKPSKLKAKPHTVLYVGKSKNTAYNFMSLFLNLSWLSIKALDFINWSIIYILVHEGKHITSQGKYIVIKLKARTKSDQSIANEYAITVPKGGEVESEEYMNGSNLVTAGQLINKIVLELLNSPSNYIESDQQGVFKVISNYKGLPSVIHKKGSFVLATPSGLDPEDTQQRTLKFISNAECANYFEVSKVSVGRWINKNVPIPSKKGVFLFTKAYDGIYS